MAAFTVFWRPSWVSSHPLRSVELLLFPSLPFPGIHFSPRLVPGCGRPTPHFCTLSCSLCSSPACTKALPDLPYLLFDASLNVSTQGPALPSPQPSCLGAMPSSACLRPSLLLRPCPHHPDSDYPSWGRSGMYIARAAARRPVPRGEGACT